MKKNIDNDKSLSTLARLERRVPEDLGIGAALQCCPIARQFASTD